MVNSSNVLFLCEKPELDFVSIPFVVLFQETSSLLRRLGTLKDREKTRSVLDDNDVEEPVSLTGLETFSLNYKVC